MKIKATAIILILSLIIPCAVFFKGEKTKATEADVFKILDETSGEILSVSDRDFLIGAIVCEMPLSFTDEALKAQGIASYTHYSKLRNESSKEYDFSADLKNFYVYTDKENMKLRFGEKYNEYYERLSAIADEIYGKVLTYENELITATYFAVSSGNTESSRDIWGGELPYLQAVASPWDSFYDGFCEKSKFTLNDVNVILESEGLSPCEKLSDVFGELKRTASGSVTSAILSGEEISGSDIRNMFSLRSQNFTVSVENDSLAFVTKGYGHGVGMSQVGANELSKMGYNYKSILKWYYKNCEITQIK